MSELYKMREWLTVEETANQLTMIGDGSVTVNDIYQYVLAGNLVLSIKLKHFPNARRGVIEWHKQHDLFSDEDGRELDPKIDMLKISDIARQYLPIGGAVEPLIDRKEKLVFHTKPEQFLKFNPDISFADGVWDLMMKGQEKLIIEQESELLTSGEDIRLSHSNGILLKRDDQYVQLLEKRETDSGNKDSTNPKYHPVTAKAFPPGSNFVVRTDALADFIKQSSVKSKKSSKHKYSVVDRTRTMLSIIEGLCKKLDIKIDSRKTTGIFVEATEFTENPVKEDACREVLKEIRARY